MAIEHNIKVSTLSKPHQLQELILITKEFKIPALTLKIEEIA